MRAWLSKVLDSSRWTPFLKVEPAVQKPEPLDWSAYPNGIINFDEITAPFSEHPYLVDPSPMQGPVKVTLIHKGEPKHRWKLLFANETMYMFECQLESCDGHYYCIPKEHFHA